MLTFNSGYWAVIIGGSSGFGLATAKKLAAHGMNLCIVHRDRKGAMSRIQPLFDDLKSTGVKIKTFNMDALDPVEAPGVGTPVPGGISYREAHLLMEILSDSGKLGSMDLVEINPILDIGNLDQMEEMSCLSEGIGGIDYQVCNILTNEKVILCVSIK